MNYTIFLILFITSLSCSLIGVFIMLRNLSMVTDAISHSVLLGIVLAYFITKDITSPLLIVGAGLFGLLTVFTIESLSKTGLVKNDDAVGIVFPLFFALAVILITKYARNVHIDTDVVLMGEVILAPLNTINFFGSNLPKALIFSSIVFLINLSFILIFYKELKITTFDKDFATISGFSSVLLFYSLMGLSSLTAVVSFDSVGAILVISFFIVPGASAYLLTKTLKNLLFLTVIFSFISCYLGFSLGYILNVSMSGMTATVSGLLFFLAALFNRDGLITKIFRSIKNKSLTKSYLILIHIGHHLGNSDEQIELSFDTIKDHLNWDKKITDSHLKYLLSKKLIFKDEDKKIYGITNAGFKKYLSILKEYNMM
ncbi:metal ABC transporter permease [Peptoniphilus raoultii]|uniref:metal ABC transporter permease n=1 Tax=Peptoniphilus raoultii TaxID=1776387 RepID=UPI0008DA58B0|nr:metal ABC transporter permease [Peptoniphilus raoultii]